MSKAEDRIDELEMRMAHQDRTIGELNDVITAQWKRLELLERKLNRLGEDLEALEPAGVPPSEKPPHY